jgi:protein tyrosine phosphatase (PTP) superfamily phosphohydrolase (DUF442 family)
MVGGNLLILALSLILGQLVKPPTPSVTVPGVNHLSVVDARVWRSSAPSTMASYEALAAAGVSTIVDLRSDAGDTATDTPIKALGLDVVHLPIRDGQVPTQDQVATFLRVVKEARGTVLVHCAAGVGRTGTMVASYLEATGQASGLRATVRNLAIGPPSLEQIAFSLGLHDAANRPPLPLVAASRILDAPRRIWSEWGF